MGNVIKYDIDAAQKKLSAVKHDVLSIDTGVDYTQSSDEEYGKAGKSLAENDKKLHDLLVEVQSLYDANHSELLRHREAGQQVLFDVETIEYEDADGTVLRLGFTKETKTTVNRAQLDSETGVSVSVSGSNLDLYTKPSVRARKKKVQQAVEAGIISSGCITTTTTEQGHFVFDETNKKGGK